MAFENTGYWIPKTKDPSKAKSTAEEQGLVDAAIKAGYSTSDEYLMGSKTQPTHTRGTVR